MRSIRMIRWTLLPLAALLASAAMAHAATHPGVGVFGRAWNNHAPARVVGRLPSTAKSGTYVYGWDGTCPDGIDVYKAEGTGLSFVQNVSISGSCGEGTWFGSHHLAVAKTPADCLIFTDGIEGDGDVYSFTIDPSTGILSTSPVSTVTVGGFPEDLAVSGSTVFESNSNWSNPAPTIDVLTVGSGCSLTLDSQNSTGTEEDIDIALANPTTVVSTDQNSGDMVAYTLQPNKTLVETAASPGQIALPQGVATVGIDTGHALVYTGQAEEGVPQTQGFLYTGGGFNAVSGSPQTSGDPNTIDGPAVAVSRPDQLLVQANTLSSQVSWDTLSSTGGNMTYGGDTSLAQTGDQPTQITVAGNLLLVAQSYNGDVEACSLATSGVSNCRTIATLTGAGSGKGGSVAVF